MNASREYKEKSSLREKLGEHKKRKRRQREQRTQRKEEGKRTT